MGYTNESKIYLRALGRRLRQLRIRRHLSQEELAFKCKLHRTYVGAVERGERNISVLTLRKITNALKVSVPQLFDAKKNISQ